MVPGVEASLALQVSYARHYTVTPDEENGGRAIAGGGEDAETPLEAAKREAREEAQIKGELPFLQLQTIVPIRAVGFPDRHLWDDDVHVIPSTVLV